MKVTIANNLICPLDGERLRSSQKQWVCPDGHSFDVARQGYVNLLPVQNKRSKHPGDSKAMVAARTKFLASGVYQPVAARLVEIVKEHFDTDAAINLLDAGCGEGYYTHYLLRQLAEMDGCGELSITGIDISKPAIIAAARRSRDIAWLVASNRQIPVLEENIDLILCLFGFMSAEGFDRVLKSRGKILLVDPGQEHLKELRDVIYAQDKTAKSLATDVDTEAYSIVDSQRLTFKTGIINQSQIDNLLFMTPHRFRVKEQGKEAAARLQKIDLTVDIMFRLLEKSQC